MGQGLFARRRLTAPAGGVVKGTAYLIGSLLVVARSNAAAAEYFTGAVGGKWQLPKTSAQAWTEGQPIYWDDSNHRCDSDATVGKLIGSAAAVAANPSTTGSVLLNGVATGADEGIGLDATELGLLNGATAGSLTASKVVTRDAGKRIPHETASPAAAGNSAGTATAIAAQVNHVTAADGTKGVILPVGVAGMVIDIVNSVTTATALLKVYPDTGGAINGGSANAAFSVTPGARARFVCTAALTWVTAPNDALLPVAGVAMGYKLARGQHTTLSASDTVVTGLATVVSVVASYETDPADANCDVSAQVGNQSGAPAAGSIIIKTWQNTSGNDPTPTAAGSFSKLVNWIAIGT